MMKKAQTLRGFWLRQGGLGHVAGNPSRNSIKSIIKGEGRLFNCMIKKHQREFGKMGSRWRRGDSAEQWLRKGEAPRSEQSTQSRSQEPEKWQRLGPGKKGARQA